jgi:ParB/RepB/Spo0J family partition protein
MPKAKDLKGQIKGGMAAFTKQESSEPMSLHPNLLEPRESQQRNSVDAQDTADIDESIKAEGVFQPIVIRNHPRKPGKYEIISGERRWRSATTNGLDVVPVRFMKDCSDELFEVIQWTENMQRKDLRLKDKVLAIGRVRTTFGLSKPTEIARVLGEDRVMIHSYLTLLDGPSEILDLCFEESDIRKLYELSLLWKDNEEVANVFIHKMKDGGNGVSRSEIAKARKDLVKKAEVSVSNDQVRGVGGSSPEVVPEAPGAAGSSPEVVPEAPEAAGSSPEVVVEAPEVAGSSPGVAPEAVYEVAARKSLVEFVVMINGKEGKVVFPTDLIDEKNVNVRFKKGMEKICLSDLTFVNCNISI